MITSIQTKLIDNNPELAGGTLCPIILGSDKTTVSVATGQNDFYPLYLSHGLFDNCARQSRKGVALIGFLSIPKSEVFG